MNTSKYIPFKSISAIILKRDDYPEYPFFSGTGFFAYFPPFKTIYFITARHCIVDSNDIKIGNLHIPFDAEEGSSESVPFLCQIETSYHENPEEIEDIAIFVVDNLPKEKHQILMKRALRLEHQDNVEYIINHIIEHKEKIRTVGFPGVSKSIDYDLNQAKIQPRGFHANIAGKGIFKNWFKIKNESWKSGELDGFSGSPILALLPSLNNKVIAMPVGILVTESSFISINVATNLIAAYITQL